ncbi:MAG: adenine deaminase [Planctomycetaceae bacterium]|nr:adenine deaminase [Planctomycetaceae bacterium]
MDHFTLTGRVVDIHAGRVFSGVVEIANGRIAAIRETSDAVEASFLLPGFVDAHVHIESSMMVPSEFARFAAPHGTVATVSDPHEIANVLGADGVRFMVENARRVPFKFHFGVPSCVPATAFETAGATLDASAVARLFDELQLGYLAEVMNFPGVLAGDADLLAKIAAARCRGLPIDGHAPGLRGTDAARYATAGPSTDHECVTLDEALDKIAAGMKILIREGSAAKNFAALHPLLATHPAACMFCSDDLHPDNLVRGHIDRLVARAVREGHELMAVLRAASTNPVQHYGLPVGLLRVGDPADLIAVNNLHDFRVRRTYIDGRLVAEDEVPRFDRVAVTPQNQFNATTKTMEEFAVPLRGSTLRVIDAFDGKLVTGELHLPAKNVAGQAVADPAADVLKIVVVNRYADAPPAIGFIRGFGLKRGAIASSVAHDSHNVVAVGTTDQDLCAAVNAIIVAKGGLAVADTGRVDVLELPVAGLMSADGEKVAADYARLDTAARELGSSLTAPFMTLSFMALLVIPALKLSDRGLFDGGAFRFASVFVSDPESE